MLVQVGSNDVYSDLKVKVEDTLRDYHTLIDKIKEKRTNGIVVGILPRLRVPNEKNRMAQMINDKVKTLCNSKGVKFANFWTSYIDNESLYNSDGVHLSKKVKEKLGDLINLNLCNLLCMSGNYQSWEIDRQNRIVDSGGSGKILTTQSVNANISINKGRKIIKKHGHIHKHKSESRGIVGVIREETVDRIHCKSSIYIKVNVCLYVCPSDIEKMGEHL